MSALDRRRKDWKRMLPFGATCDFISLFSTVRDGVVKGGIVFVGVIASAQPGTACIEFFHLPLVNVI